MIGRMKARKENPGVPAAHVKGRPRLLRVLFKDTRGVTAVEFSLIIVPFLGLLLALVQVGLYLFASEGLDVAVQDAARNIYTGIAQTSGISTATAFRTAYICPVNQPRKLPSFIDCNALIIDVRTVSSFTSADLNADFYKTTTTFCPGSPGDIVIVRVIYPMPVIVPVLVRSPTASVSVLRTGTVNDVPGNSGWKQLLLGTAVFQNEPYDGSNYVPPTAC